MTPVEQESILTLSLIAAFADGSKNDAERTYLSEPRREPRVDARKVVS